MTRRSSDASRRTRDLIRAELHRGGYPDGKLPGEDLLMQSYQVSRSVIREALSLLRTEGLIDRIQGIGTVVISNHDPAPLEETQGVVPAREGSPFAGRLRPVILDHSPLRLPAPIAVRLEVPVGAPGVRVDYVAYLDGQPMWIATNYMRMPEAANLSQPLFRTDYYAYLAQVGLVVSQTTYLMEATLADEHDVALLDLPPGAAVMAGEQTLFNDAGQPFNFALVRGRGDRSAILSRVGRAAPRGQSTTGE